MMIYPKRGILCFISAIHLFHPPTIQVKRERIARKTNFSSFQTHLRGETNGKFTSFQTLTGSRASIAMLDVRLLCDTEFVVVDVGLDSVATFFCCSLLRTSSQTFSTPPPFCVGGFACVVLL